MEKALLLKGAFSIFYRLKVAFSIENAQYAIAFEIKQNYYAKYRYDQRNTTIRIY